MLLNNPEILNIWILGRPPGYDRVRNAEIGNKDFELDVLEEAYTSEHWIVRIYKVTIAVDKHTVLKFYFLVLRSKTYQTEGVARKEHLAQLQVN